MQDRSCLAAASGFRRPKAGGAVAGWNRASGTAQRRKRREVAGSGVAPFGGLRVDPVFAADGTATQTQAKPTSWPCPRRGSGTMGLVVGGHRQGRGSIGPMSARVILRCQPIRLLPLCGSISLWHV